MTKKEILYVDMYSIPEADFLDWIFSGRCIRHEDPSNSNDEDIEIVEVNDNKTVIINAITECQNDNLIINESTQLQTSPA